MYVTAGLGPKETNEGFTEPYDLPNETAYAETCASVALVFWAQRMLHLDLDGRYADVMELALYNGALSGLSRDGDALLLRQSAREPRPAPALGVASLPLLHDERLAAGRLDRRLLRSRPARTASPSISTAASRPKSSLGGVEVALRESERLSVVGRYPDRGRPAAPARFDLKLRIPGWAKGASATVNGEATPLSPSCAAMRRFIGAGAPGDVVTLTLPMPPERLYAHPQRAHGRRARRAAGAAR